MDKKIKTKSNTLKNYVIPLGIIACAFILAGCYIISLINTTLLQQMVDDSNRHAYNHMSRLSNSISATDIIEKLLEEKIVVSSNVILNHRNELSNDFLKEMIDDLKVDEICWYNSSGEIIYTSDKYIGWQAVEGHPAHNFMIGNEDIVIEDIRKDTESDKYYKFGYVKADNGEFLQIGILADNIDELTKKFSSQKFVDILVDNEDILHVYILDNQNKVIFCESETNNKQYTLDISQIKAIEANKANYVKKTYNNIQSYEVLLPIYIDNVKMGSLVIVYSLENTNNLIKNISLITTGLLIFIFLVYSFMTITIGTKNKEIKELAYYDKATKLLNKSYFMEFLKDKIKNSTKNRKALIIINCSNLDLVKLISGNQILDELLLEKANTLKKLNFREDYLFKYAEDSFLIYLDDYGDKNELLGYSKQIIEMLDGIISIKDSSKLVTKKIGILEISQDYKDADEIIRHLEITINKIKKLKDKSCWFFNDTLQKELILDEMIEKELRRATYDGYKEEFYLEYQPQVDLQTNKILGLEALARWKSKELGIIPPLKFIDIAERFQLITPLGEWIILTACKFIRNLEERDIKNIKVAVNISVIQLLQENFIENLMNIINETQINPRNLELEITESNLMSSYEIVNTKLKSLRKKGISISLDDFGTGYSSLARLKNLNIDVLKIDKIFIDNITKFEQEDIFVQSIVLLANQLGLKTVAEGVETEEQREYLKTQNCNIMQGYLFSKPITDDEVIKLINETNEIKLPSHKKINK